MLANYHWLDEYQFLYWYLSESFSVGIEIITNNSEVF